jgi:prophage regulatory protein
MVIIDYDGLRERGIRYSRAHLWRLSTKGKFPKPIKLSPSRNAWLESDVDFWIESRVARGRHEFPLAAGPTAA